jgi:hypothetical protein
MKHLLILLTVLVLASGKLLTDNQAFMSVDEVRRRNGRYVIKVENDLRLPVLASSTGSRLSLGIHFLHKYVLSNTKRSSHELPLEALRRLSINTSTPYILIEIHHYVDTRDEVIK